jgi:superfamily I DNA and/or RNA helicase
MSIDANQGSEHDMVIIGTSRTEGHGFIDNPNRVCVALSRAKNLNIVIGNIEYLKNAT